MAQGDYAEALKRYHKSLAIKEKTLGTDHPSTGTTYNNIAVVYQDQGNYAEALKWYKKGYYIRRKKLGEAHPNTKIVLDNMKTAYNSAGLTEAFETWLIKTD